MKIEYIAIIKKLMAGGSAGQRKYRVMCVRRKTREELIETLKITLQEAIEFNKEEALIAA